MPEIKYRSDKGTPEQRIANRLKNSGGEEADHVVQKGTGPTRTFHNIHHGGSARVHGKAEAQEERAERAERAGKPEGEGD